MKNSAQRANIYPEIVQDKVLKLDEGTDLIVTDPLAGEGSLPRWALRYLEDEVVGVQSRLTALAKIRDLARFIRWFGQANGHVMIEQWMARDTQGFLQHLEKTPPKRHRPSRKNKAGKNKDEAAGHSPATINRAFATLRRFARWCHLDSLLMSSFVLDNECSSQKGRRKVPAAGMVQPDAAIGPM